MVIPGVEPGPSPLQGNAKSTSAKLPTVYLIYFHFLWEKPTEGIKPTPTEYETEILSLNYAGIDTT